MTKVLAFHKPYGVLSSFTDPGGRPNLKDFITDPDVYSVGRLDMDSEGLLLLTDDGTLIHRLTDPRYDHTKAYLVMLEGVPTQEALNQLADGVDIQGYRTLPAQAERIEDPGLPERTKPVTPHGPTSWIRLVLREGKKRQIRHMTAAVGYPTLRLVRVQIGPIRLGDLHPGEYRYLVGEDLQWLCSLTEPPARVRRIYRNRHKEKLSHKKKL